jgi:imidazolonepropionase-like amidohydrolase
VECYTARRVLTGEKGEVVTDGCVVVDGGVIAWAGPVAQLPPEYAGEARRIDLDDATLMPGLIDSHVHLGFDGGPAPVGRMRAETDAQQLILMLRSARELLGAGVTTARDLGARSFLDVAVRDAIASGMTRGPRMVTAGRPLTPTGGHCWFMGGECDSEDEVRKMVRLHHKNRTDLIKVMSTGGFMTHGSAPWFAQFSGPQLAAAVAEAQRLGKKVAAHAHGVEGIRRALDAGVDTLEHCSFVLPDGSVTVDDELVDRIAASGTYVCPTVNVRSGEVMARQGKDVKPAVSVLYQRGAKIIAGTDAGIDRVPHYAYVAGLEGLVSLGLPPAEVLYTATAQAAEALGVADVTGRLKPGMAADMIVADGDPLADISVLRTLRLILRDGMPFIPDPVTPDAASAGPGSVGQGSTGSSGDAAVPRPHTGAVAGQSPRAAVSA